MTRPPPSMAPQPLAGPPDPDADGPLRVWFICTAPDPVPPQIAVRTGRFEDLTAAALAGFLPAVVVMPLLSHRVDAMQILQKLGQLGYGGSALVICPALPEPALVAAEMQASFPQMQIILLPPGTPLPF